MSYIENIYVCLAAPLLIAALCMKAKGQRMMVFLLAGMTSCLLSSYISTFLATAKGMSVMTATMELSPEIEEIMKFLPMLFYLLVFEPKREEITDGILMIAVGFATFENACYLTNNGAAQILHLLIRGFSTGAMHVVCGFLVAIGMLYLWDRAWLRVAGTMGLLSVAMTFHGIYNILVSQPDPIAYVGYIIPAVTLMFGLIFGRKMYRRKPSKT